MASFSSFEYRGHRIWVPIRVDGKELRGLLDTGSDGTVVDTLVAERLGLSTRERIEASTVAGSVQVGQTGPVTIELGERTLEAESVSVLPISSHLPGLDLILGFDMLRAVAFTIDYASTSVHWDTLPGGVGVEFVAEDDIRPTVWLEVFGRRVAAHLDTGSAQGVSLPTEWVHQIAGDSPKEQEQRSVLASKVTAEKFFIEDATLAGIVLTSVPAEAVTAEGGSFAEQDTGWANVGNLVLERFRLGIDGPTRRAVLKPAKAGI